jgi:hypothetical protein
VYSDEYAWDDSVWTMSSRNIVYSSEMLDARVQMIDSTTYWSTPEQVQIPTERERSVNPNLRNMLIVLRRIKRMVHLRTLSGLNNNREEKKTPASFVLPPFLFISRRIVQICTIRRLIKRNGGSTRDWAERQRKKSVVDKSNTRCP